MTNKFFLYIVFVFILLSNCSFDDKTGIWQGSEKEKRRLSELEEEQKQLIEVTKVYSSKDIYSKQVDLKQKIILSKPKKSWLPKNISHFLIIFGSNFFSPDQSEV